MNDETVAALAAWMSGQRWYPRGLGPAAPRIVGAVPLGEDRDDRRIRILLVASGDEVYQLPVVERPADPERPRPHTVLVDRDRVLVDGPHDPEFAAELVAAIAGDPRIARTVTSSRVLPGEQSNTSIVVSRPGARDLVIKVLRVVRHGPHREIETAEALSRVAGAPVPMFVGAVEADWVDASGERGHGQLVVAQQFVRDAEDAWTIANVEAAAGRDFASAANALGRATAALHRSLAEAFPTQAPNGDAAAELAAVWHTRLEAALADVPALAPSAAAVRDRYDRARAATWPTLQRIHGDLHLGQVIRAPGADAPWLFVDFEGEPLHPGGVAPVVEPPARDLAGMIRSFDYAAAGSPVDAEWADRCRESYLAGYRAAGGDEGDPALLAAFELDKAVYEARYEARNRPDWLPIPLAAISRLLDTPAG